DGDELDVVPLRGPQRRYAARLQLTVIRVGAETDDAQLAVLGWRRGRLAGGRLRLPHAVAHGRPVAPEPASEEAQGQEYAAANDSGMPIHGRSLQGHRFLPSPQELNRAAAALQHENDRRSESFDPAAPAVISLCPCTDLRRTKGEPP